MFRNLAIRVLYTVSRTHRSPPIAKYVHYVTFLSRRVRNSSRRGFLLVLHVDENFNSDFLRFVACTPSDGYQQYCRMLPQCEVHVSEMPCELRVKWAYSELISSKMDLVQLSLICNARTEHCYTGCSRRKSHVSYTERLLTHTHTHTHT
jgi:hypothetical protein